MVTFEQSYSVLWFIQLLVIHVTICNTCTHVYTHTHTQREKIVLKKQTIIYRSYI